MMLGVAFFLPLLAWLLLHKLAKFVSLWFLFDGPNRSCCRNFWRPLPRANSAVHSRHRNPVFFGNFGVCFSRWRNANNRSVPCLLFSVSPSAIFWGIAERIVNPFNAQVVHITSIFRPSLEYYKSVPFLANGNTLGPVVLPSDIFRVVAPGSHVLPAHIQAGLFHRSRLTPCDSRLTTTAGSAFSVSEIAGQNRSLFAANAPAKPQRSTLRRVPGLMKNGPATKNSACHVNQRRIFCHA